MSVFSVAQVQSLQAEKGPSRIEPVGGYVLGFLLCSVVAIVLLVTKSEMLALAAAAALGFCAFLFLAPPLWLACLLIILVPFQSLFTQLLGGFDSSGRQVFALWKEALIGVGILRSFLRHPAPKAILASNRWVVVFSILLGSIYCITFVRLPSVAGVLSFNLETRFLGVMLFFMLLDIGGERVSTLLRAMIWSIGILAIYGLIQYFWDYDRLLPLVYNIPDLSADGIRRLYSYSLGPLEPAYGAMIGILVLLSGFLRSRRWSPAFWLLALFPCLALTFTRSAYIGLFVGALTLIAANRFRLRLLTVLAGTAIAAILSAILFGGPALSNLSLSKRLVSIISQSDQSSVDHKDSMKHAVELISEHPLGIGLGKYGMIGARFTDGDSSKTENWVLQVSVQNGIVGGAAYILLSVAILSVLVRKRTWRDDFSCALNAAAASVFIAMTIAGVMIPVWDLMIPTIYTWALVGLALGTTLQFPGSRNTLKYDRSLGLCTTRTHQQAGAHSGQ